VFVFGKFLAKKAPRLCVRINSNFDKIVGSSLEQQKKNLDGDKFVYHCLIGYVGDKSYTQSVESISADKKNDVRYSFLLCDLHNRLISRNKLKATSSWRVWLMV
jgi:hypothetical protein